MRKSLPFILYVCIFTFLFAGLCVHASHQRIADEPVLREMATLVNTLGITDIALFTEARYTRHPSQADLFSPFQDNPMSFEHFPSGSFVKPPDMLRKNHGNVDR
jgi:hypothetical protein